MTIGVVVTLTVAIGAMTVLLSVIERTLLRPLPFPRPAELVEIEQTKPELRTTSAVGQNPTLLAYRAWREHSKTLSMVGAYLPRQRTLEGHGPARHVATAAVSSDLLRLLGVVPVRGATFAAADDEPGGPRVALVSTGFWTREFAREAALGRHSITLDGTRFRVVGVMPGHFRFPIRAQQGATTDAEVWTSFGEVLSRTSHGMRIANVGVVARLRSGVTRAAAELELDRITRENVPADSGDAYRATLIRHVSDHVASVVRRPLLLLLAAVACLLGVACANIANLLLARAQAREREIAVRSALGAGAGRIVRQLLTESLVLALVGAVPGVLLAVWGTPTLARIAAAVLPNARPVSVDPRVLGACLAVALATGLLFGLAPALHLGTTSAAGALRDGGRGSGVTRRRRWLIDALLVGQVAMTMVLLVGAGVLLRTIQKLRSAPLGFGAEHLVTGSLSLSGERYATVQRQNEFALGLLRELERLPGVSAATVATGLPFAAGAFVVPVVDGGAGPADLPPAFLAAVMPGYFRVLDIPIRRGRAFSTAAESEALLIDEAAARAYFRGRDPLGQRLTWRRGREGGIVIGVTGDVVQLEVGEAPRPHIYRPLAGAATPALRVALRTGTRLPEAAAALRRAVAMLDPSLPVDDVWTMRQLMSRSISRNQLLTLVLAILAAAALVIAATGVYSVGAYVASQRRAEMGIRLALGAQPADILTLMVGRGLVTTIIGIALGAAVAAGGSRVLRAYLHDYGVAPRDPAVFLAIAVFLLAVSGVAWIIPARRTASVDPSSCVKAV